jgi:hypothetical protein
VISRKQFKKEWSAPMKSNPWITYRTRFLVKAKQLTASLTFTDVHGRQQSGSKGDYLVESNDGVLTIARRQIFEDIYVPLLEQLETAQRSLSPDLVSGASGEHGFSHAVRSQKSYRGTALVVPNSDPSTVEERRFSAASILSKNRGFSSTLPSQLTRKSPQPYRDRRGPLSGARSL